MLARFHVLQKLVTVYILLTTAALPVQYPVKQGFWALAAVTLVLRHHGAELAQPNHLEKGKRLYHPHPAKTGETPWFLRVRKDLSGSGRLHKYPRPPGGSKKKIP